LPSLAEGKRGEDGMICTILIAAEGITFGWQGLLFCTVKKPSNFSMSPQGIPL